jgi:Skp family chaperone for outer membrane proteins
LAARQPLGIFIQRRVRRAKAHESHGRQAAREQGALQVKTSLLTAAVVAGSLVIVGASTLPAQNRPAAAATGQSIAVIDIGAVFKGHLRFKAMTDKWKEDVLAAEKAFKSEGETLNKSAKQLQDLRPGSPDYKKLEEELTKQQSDLNARMSLQKKAFMEREAKIYYAIYQEIQDEVKYYAEAKGVAMVVRHDSAPIDPNNRNSVMAGINKTVLYQQPGLDITNVILNELNRRAGNGPGTATKPGTQKKPGALN